MTQTRYSNDFDYESRVYVLDIVLNVVALIVDHDVDLNSASFASL